MIAEMFTHIAVVELRMTAIPDTQYSPAFALFSSYVIVGSYLYPIRVYNG